MERKVVGMVLTFASLFVLTTSAFADLEYTYEFDDNLLSNSNYNEVIIRSENDISYIYNPDATDPELYFNGSNMGRASIVVTASDVWRESVYDSEYPSMKKYRAVGYVTAAQYHYAQAELRFNFGELTGEKIYGYGKVNAKTDYSYFEGGTARIYYGA